MAVHVRGRRLRRRCLRARTQLARRLTPPRRRRHTWLDRRYNIRKNSLTSRSRPFRPHPPLRPRRAWTMDRLALHDRRVSSRPRPTRLGFHGSPAFACSISPT